MESSPSSVLYAQLDQLTDMRQDLATLRLEAMNMTEETASMLMTLYAKFEEVQQAAAARGEASAKASLAAAQSRVDKLTADVARLTAANLSLRNSTETEVRAIRQASNVAMIGVAGLLRKKVSAVRRDWTAVSTLAAGFRTAVTADFAALAALLARQQASYGAAAERSAEQLARTQLTAQAAEHEAARLAAVVNAQAADLRVQFAETAAARSEAADRAEALAAHQQLHISFRHRMEEKVKAVEARVAKEQEHTAAAVQKAVQLQAQVQQSDAAAAAAAAACRDARATAAVMRALVLDICEPDEVVAAAAATISMAGKRKYSEQRRQQEQVGEEQQVSLVDSVDVEAEAAEEAARWLRLHHSKRRRTHPVPLLTSTPDYRPVVKLQFPSLREVVPAAALELLRTQRQQRAAAAAGPVAAAAATDVAAMLRQHRYAQQRAQSLLAMLPA